MCVVAASALYGRTRETVVTLQGISSRQSKCGDVWDSRSLRCGNIKKRRESEKSNYDIVDVVGDEIVEYCVYV